MIECVTLHRYTRQMLNKEPVYQAIWAQNTDFDEVIISPVMLQDHMPDTVLEALKKVSNQNNSFVILLYNVHINVTICTYICALPC